MAEWTGKLRALHRKALAEIFVTGSASEETIQAFRKVAGLTPKGKPKQSQRSQFDKTN